MSYAHIAPALVPNAVFTAVPSCPQHSSAVSDLGNAIITASLTSQSIILPSDIFSQFRLRYKGDRLADEFEDPGYSTIEDNEPNTSLRAVKKQNTIESVQFTPVISTKAVNEERPTTSKEHIDVPKKSTKHKEVSPDILGLYAIPTKRPVSVQLREDSNHSSQIKSLGTLKIMKLNENKEAYSSTKEEIKLFASYDLSAIELDCTRKHEDLVHALAPDTMVRTTIPLQASSQFVSMDSQEVDFLYEIQFKLDKLKSYMQAYLRDHMNLHQHVLENEQAKMLWQEKLKEAQHILEDNMFLRNDFIKLEENYNEKGMEAHELGQELTDLRDINQELSQSNEQLQEECNVLRQRCKDLVAEKKKMLFRDDHNAIIFEIQRLLENLKEKYSEETNHLKYQLDNASKQKQRSKVDVIKLENEVSQLRQENRALSKAYRGNHKKCLYLLEQLKMSQEWGDEAQELLMTVLLIAEQTEDERGLLMQKSEKLGQEQLHLVTAVMQRSASLSNLRDRFQNLKVKVVQEVENMNFRIDASRAKSKHIQETCQKEVKQLKKVIVEKNHNIKAALQQKRNLEDDLKNLWKIAAKD